MQNLNITDANFKAIKTALMIDKGIKTRNVDTLEVLNLALDNDIITRAQFDEYTKPQTAPQTAPQPQPQGDSTMTPQTAPQTAGVNLDHGAQLAELIKQLAGGAIPQTAPLDEQKVIELINTHANTPIKYEVTIKRPDSTTKKQTGITHKCFKRALNQTLVGNDIYFHGATGAGKSTTAEMIANTLELDFYVMGAILSKFEVLGALTSQVYLPSIVRQWIENPKGGLLCIDEIDASDPRQLVTIMAIFDESGVLTFPDGKTFKRTENHRIIITGNTVGAGASSMYNGRLKLDEATKSRFVMIEHDYCENIEKHLACPELLQYAQAYRQVIADKGLHGALITPRTLKQAQKVISADGIQGADKSEMLKDIFKKALSESEFNSVVKGIDSSVRDAFKRVVMA